MTTLTTTDGDVSSPQNLNSLTDAMNMDSYGKAKPVVSQLVYNWRKLMKAECNVNLFTNLLKLDISTKDIFFFVQKQADMRKVHKDLDKPLSRMGMRSKLNDACAFVCRQKRIVSRLKRELLNPIYTGL